MSRLTIRGADGEAALIGVEITELWARDEICDYSAHGMMIPAAINKLADYEDAEEAQRERDACCYRIRGKEGRGCVMAGRPNITPHEDVEQYQLMRWAAYEQGAYPELALLYHIANGGKRPVRVAARLKTQGVKSGVPDLHLPVSRGGYHSLYIELKRQAGGSTSDAQKSWIKDLQEQGNFVAVCRGAEAAEKVILAYLQGRLTRG